MTKKEKNNIDQKNQLTLIYVFIPSISAKNNHAVNVFLKENKFTKILNTKKKHNLIYTQFFINANYILETHQMISQTELQKIMNFLTKHSILMNGVVWNGYLLNHKDQFGFKSQEKQPLIPQLVL